VLPSPSDKKAVIIFFVTKRRVGEWALSMVGVEERREFRFRGDLYSQESTFPLVVIILILFSYVFCGEINDCSPQQRRATVARRFDRGD